MLTLYRLISFYDSLPLDDTYRAATETILRNLEQIPKLSREALAELCHSSPTTINRLVSKIGCASFSEFKMRISEALEQYDLQTYKMAGSKLLRDPDPHAAIHSMAKSIASICDHISREDFDRVCAAIRGHRRICFYTDVRDGCISPDKRQLQLDFILDGKETDFLFDPALCLESARRLNKDCLAIIPCSTYAPAMKHALALMLAAKECGAAVLAIAPQNTPQISSIADYVLEFVEDIANTDGHIVDVLAYCIALHYCRMTGRL